jgi:hypothetical protein
VNRALRTVAAAVGAVLAALSVTSGIAAAATPTRSTPATATASYAVAQFPGQWLQTDWDDTDYDVDQADATGILGEYFGYVPDGSSAGEPTMLSCPDAPGPGKSAWNCERVPVSSVVGKTGTK